MRILLTEDNQDLAQITIKNLRREGFSIDPASTAKQTLKLLESGENYDVIVLDLNLPDQDGLKLLSKCKKLSPLTPTLALTGRDSEQDRIKGLEKGFDDYLTKPFSFKELAARLRVLYRLKSKKPETIILGLLKIFPQSHEVKIANKTVKLTSHEFRLLYLLAKNKGKTLSSKEILEKVWDRNSQNDKAKLMTTISRLRKKLADHKKQIIKTLKNGYKVA